MLIPSGCIVLYLTYTYLWASSAHSNPHSNNIHKHLVHVCGAHATCMHIHVYTGQIIHVSSSAIVNMINCQGDGHWYVQEGGGGGGGWRIHLAQVLHHNMNSVSTYIFILRYIIPIAT